MNSPRVGVTTSKNGSLMMWVFYWLSLRLGGIRPKRLVAPVDTNILKSLDGLVIGGGDDISAHLYQGEPRLDIRIDPERDELEKQAIHLALERDIPILGICRGAQMLNVLLGGSLHQDIYETYEGVPVMRTPLPKKKVFIEENSRLSKILGKSTCLVNALHHQSIDRSGQGLQVCARDRHGIVQAVEDPNADFRIGVQWHPEFLIFNKSQRALFHAFVKAVCKRLKT